MAFEDWNHDGINDFKDDLYEYELYNESRNYSSPGSSGGENFKAILSMVGGFLLAGGILIFLGAEDDVPVFLIVALWVICSTALSVWLDGKGV